jgi:hypothetical protein
MRLRTDSWLRGAGSFIVVVCIMAVMAVTFAGGHGCR